MASSSLVVLAAMATVAALLLSPATSLPVFTGDASPGFHAASCPQLDGIVWSSVEAALRQESFATRGLGDVADLVALSGAHTIGRSQCGSFEDRSQRADDTFSRKLAANCSKHPERLQNLDVITPDLFDNAYYKALGFNQGVFTSDMALVKNKTTAAIVKRFAESKDAFFGQFARSMEKLARVPKPAGNVGEIRRFSCFRSNAQRADAAVDAAGEEEEEGFSASA
ncbi:unnamed protein product [Triticum turgidum subsp. durum]|uniref:Plant heme peroxidase family profile domain-containing protein n=1 Tax=Triticum turgidum subsp. durum TaxID=4567 RepID=A0A9R1P9N6_TRITD|nr:unnamed protein product [Triticum turgidum subsp. durum]